MNHLKPILQSLMFTLALLVGGIGTAAAGSTTPTETDAAAGHGISAIDHNGSDVVFGGSDKDDDDDDE